MVGRHLTNLLVNNGFLVSHLSRKPYKNENVKVFRWDPDNKTIDAECLTGVDYIVHLAGANIGEKPWSRKRKKEIENSRIDSAEFLFQTISTNGIRIRAFISASAIGYYGSVTSDRIFQEDDLPGNDFLGRICTRWEAAAELFKKTGTRVVKIRTAVVMDKRDSALSKFLSAARFGIFPILGDGKQYLPWIHAEDLCNIYLKAILDENMIGSYNAAAPQHITQSEFMIVLANVLNKVRISPIVPSSILKIVMGEMSVVALKGSRINPEKLINSGFSFKFDTLETTLRNVLEKNS